MDTSETESVLPERKYVKRAMTRSHGVDQAIYLVEEVAKKEGLISKEQLATWHRLFSAAEAYAMAAPGEAAKILPQIVAAVSSKMTSEDKLAMSRFMGLGMIAAESIDNSDRKLASANADEIFYLFLKENYLQAKAGGNEDAFLDQLSQIKEKMTLRMVVTMHPTIFESMEAIKLGAHVTQKAEEAGHIEFDQKLLAKMARGASLTPEERKSPRYTARLPGEPVSLSAIEEVEARLKHAAEKISEGRSLTPLRKITIQEEDAIDGMMVDALRKRIGDAVKDWNYAAGRVAKESCAQKWNDLLIAEDKINETFQLATWGRAADHDGRPLATALNLYNGATYGMNGSGTYDGPILDLRSNAEKENKPLASALIQRSYRESRGYAKEGRVTKHSVDGGAFQQFAEQFLTKALPSGDKEARETLLADLPPQAQSDFMRELLVGKEIKIGRNSFHMVPKLIPPDYSEHIIEFVTHYAQWLKEFIQEENKTRLRGTEIPENATFLELKRYNHPGENHSHLAAKFREGLQNKGFNLSDDGSLFYVSDFNHHRDFLEDLNLTLEEPLSPTDRNQLMDLYKRLVVTNHLIGRFGKSVADRHQLANFSSETDFYVTMKLFQEAGLLEIDSGKDKQPTVTKAKLMINPLFETYEDFEKAPVIMKNLLNDPLVRDYYRAMGNKGMVMLGFSDGAKTSGNFASEAKIYETAKKLHAVFSDAGVALQIFQGRGRKEERGGEENFRQIHHLLPREMNASAALDVTLQSDQPLHDAVSPHRGTVSIANAMVGTMEGALEAAKPLPGVDQARLHCFEDAFYRIAEKAQQKYQELVRSHPQSVTFIDGMPKNPDATSRPLKRADNPTFDNQRMITVEYAGAVAKLPFLDTGLKEALQWAEKNIKVLGKDGKTELQGREALEEMNKHFSPFHGLLRKALNRQQEFDAVIAGEFATRLGAQGFAAGVIKSLTGLTSLIQDIRQEKPMRREHVRPHVRDTQATLAAMLVLSSLGDDPKVNKDLLSVNITRNRVQHEVNRNLYAIMANAHSHRPEYAQAVERSNTLGV